MDEAKILGWNIRRYRGLRGLTQAELGRKAGLSKDAISRLELGKSANIRAPHLRSVTQALDISIEVLAIKNLRIIPVEIDLSEKGIKKLIWIVRLVNKILFGEKETK